MEADQTIVPVHLDNRPLLGVQWQGAIYIDAMLPFSLRSAPKIFTAIADALKWILRHRGTRLVWHYIDDFIFCGPPASTECARTFDSALTACSELGVPVSAHKVEGPATDITVLGIRVNSITQTLSLPDDKLECLQHLLTAWGDKTYCTRWKLQSLVVILDHVCKVIQLGRSFIRRMLDLLRCTEPTAARQRHFTRLNLAFRTDLQMWHTFVADWNGVSILPSLRPISVEVVSDASGSWGCGAYWYAHWFQLQWSTRAHPLSIAVKELLPVVVAAATWGPLWAATSRVCFHCDNQSVVHDIQSRASRHPHMVHLLRCLAFLEARYQLEFSCVHIPGIRNDLADDLSRDRLSSFLHKVPEASRSPTPVSQQLIDLLMDTSSTWLTPTSISLFVSTASRA